MEDIKHIDIPLDCSGGFEAVNLRPDEQGRLTRRIGFERVGVSANGEAVRGLWYGSVGGGEPGLVYAAGDTLYRREDIYGNSPGADTVIGQLDSDCGEVTFFRFLGKLYLLDGFEYYAWNGFGGLAPVEGYIPLICEAAGRDGSGELCEEPNLLTRLVRIRFPVTQPLGDYTLPGCAGKTSVVSVTADGAAVAFTPKSAADGRVYVTVGSLVAGQTLEVTYYLPADDSLRASVTACRHGVSYDTKNGAMVFLWGGSAEGGYSDCALYVSEPVGRTSADATGTGRLPGSMSPPTQSPAPSADYFPQGSSRIIVGGGRSPVRAALRQFDSLLVFCERGAELLRRTQHTDPAGYVRYGYHCYLLNEAVGAVSERCAVCCDERLYSLDRGGFYEWVSSYNQGSRAARIRSLPVSSLLDDGFISSAYLHVLPRTGEIWLVRPDSGMILVYDCRRSLWYCHSGIPAEYMAECGGAGTLFSSGAALYAFREGRYTDCEILSDPNLIPNEEPIEVSYVSDWLEPEKGDPVDLCGLRVTLASGEEEDYPGLTLTLNSDRGNSRGFTGIGSDPGLSAVYHFRCLMPRSRALCAEFSDSGRYPLTVSRLGAEYRTV